jgi:UDP-N-acetylglucosamine 2-epimerase (non-hydrolysing)
MKNRKDNHVQHRRQCGSNMLSGCEPDAILRRVTAVLAQPPAWQPPAEYLEADVSSKVAKIVLGHR